MSSLRPREDRKTVRIRVRVRCDAGWIDATVRNVSSRGMMLHSTEPLQRNQFVEITRGRTRVIGKVVWSDNDGFGLQAQDTVDIVGLLEKPGAHHVPGTSERRLSTRPAATVRTYVTLDSATGSRLLGRAMEMAVAVAAFASVSVLAVTSALEAAEQPLEKVQLALATTPG